MDTALLIVGVVTGAALLALAAAVVGAVVGARSGAAAARADAPAPADALPRSQADTIQHQLEEYRHHVERMEARRTEDTAALRGAVEDLRRSSQEARDEARTLAGALRDGRVRGSWGEMQLRRVLELTGMLPHVDVTEQATFRGADGAGRPDAVVHLPNGRCVVIDAKAPLDRYLDASAAVDPAESRRLLAEHARAVAGHVTALAARDYSGLVPGAVDVVVLFVPGDAFLAAAHEADPALLEHAFGRGVVLASPSTLLGFLRGVALGWREERLAAEARAVADLGVELHERLCVFAGHLQKVGSGLGQAVDAYNRAVGSFDGRVLVSARRLHDLGAGSVRAVPAVTELEDRPRALRSVAGPA
ncbi:MAG: DNA recombination protein RmuC [Microthrixaceae bacterium]